MNWHPSPPGLTFIALSAISSGAHGERGGTRTHDHRLKRPMLYRLSYPPTEHSKKEPPTYRGSSSSQSPSFTLHFSISGCPLSTKSLRH